MRHQVTPNNVGIYSRALLLGSKVVRLHTVV